MRERILRVERGFEITENKEINNVIRGRNKDMNYKGYQ